jgi:chromosome segregation ATPase
MLKKMVILGVVGFVAVTVLAGTKLGSYIRAEVNEARKRAEDNIPPEKEIVRLRSELKMLDKDKMTIINQLARERVAVNELQGEMKVRSEKLSKEKGQLTERAILIKKAEENKDEQYVSLNGNKTRIDVAKVNLEADVKTFAAQQKTLDTMEATLATRIKVRDTLEKQLDALKNQERELATAIDGLEAELNDLKLQQMESKYQTDDTRLAKIKEDMRKLKTRVDVEREKLKLMPAAMEPTPAPPTSNKSVDDILAPLNGPVPTTNPAPKTNAQMPLAD